MPFVEAGAKVLAINPTCSMMLRREYPTLVAPADRDRARRARRRGPRSRRVPAGRIREEPRFARDSVAPRARRVPRRLPPARPGDRLPGARSASPSPASPTIVSVGECCGHDGTYAMKVESFEASPPHRDEGLRRHEGAPTPPSGSPTARSPPSSSSSTPERSRCTRCRCSPAPTGASRFPPQRRGDSCARVQRFADPRPPPNTSRRAATSQAAVHRDQAPPPRPRRPVPDLPVREHDDHLVPDPGDAPRRADRARGRHRSTSSAPTTRCSAAPGQLGCCLLIEIDDPRRARQASARMARAARSRLHALRGRRQGAPDRRSGPGGRARISAVQYLKFHLDDWRPISVGCDLPGLIAETTLNREQRDALNDDLRSTGELNNGQLLLGPPRKRCTYPSGTTRQSSPSDVQGPYPAGRLDGTPLALTARGGNS